MIKWLKDQARKKRMESKFQNDSEDMLAGLDSTEMLAEMLKIPQTEVELPTQLTAVGFEEGRIYVSNSAGPHGLAPGARIPAAEGLPARRAEEDGLESIDLADLSNWIARRKR